VAFAQKTRHLTLDEKAASNHRDYPIFKADFAEFRIMILDAGAPFGSLRLLTSPYFPRVFRCFQLRGLPPQGRRAAHRQHPALIRGFEALGRAGLRPQRVGAN